MKLRTKLVVAFLVMAVLPLTGLTFYTYVTSEHAARRAVEAESRVLAGEMGRRMELVAADLSRRMDRLSELPFDDLLQVAEAPDAAHYSQIYNQVMEEMGDAGVCFDALEFEPMEPAALKVAALSEDRDPPIQKKLVTEVTPAAPAAPTPPASPRALSWTSASPEAFVLVMPQSPVPPVPGSRANGVGPAVAQAAQEMKIDVSVSSDNRMVIRQISKELLNQEVQAALVEVAKAQEEIVRRSKEQGDLKRQAREVAHLASKAQELQPHKFLLEWKRDRVVSQRGQPVGRVKARLNPEEVMKRVLSRTEVQEGEIAFAVDSEGNLLSLQPGDVEKLREIGVVQQTSLTGAAASDEWVVVTREEPRFGLKLGIARPLGQALREVRATAVRNFGLGLGMIGLALLGILPLSRRMTRDVAALADGAERLSAGERAVQVPVRSRDELGQLTMTFNRMARDLRDQEERLVEQERLEKELEMCRQIQEELLPRTPLRLPFAEVKGVSIPAREVGGDFFNYFTLPGDEIAILIGDVSGKGVPAALLMANIQATLKARLPLERDLAKLVSALDHEISAQTLPETYLTLFVAILDSQCRTLSWVNGGHNTQFLVSDDGTVKRLESTGRPLGLIPGGGYDQKEINLQAGDSLFLYTDGLVEAENEMGEEFGLDRLEKILGEKHEIDLDRLLVEIEAEASRHRRGAEPGDDATMLALKIDSVRPSV